MNFVQVDDNEIISWNHESVKTKFFSMKDEYKNVLIDNYVNINKAILEQNEKLKQINNIINSYRNTIKLFDINDKFTKSNCCICYENEVNICLIPCGHSFCKTCVDKSYSNKCFICKITFTSKNRLFLSAVSEDVSDPVPTLSRSSTFTNSPCIF